MVPDWIVLITKLKVSGTFMREVNICVSDNLKTLKYQENYWRRWKILFLEHLFASCQSTNTQKFSGNIVRFFQLPRNNVLKDFLSWTLQEISLKFSSTTLRVKQWHFEWINGKLTISISLIKALLGCQNTGQITFISFGRNVFCPRLLAVL